MNLQTVIRAVVCAAIVAICIAGAGWFTTRPVAGQETKQQSLQGAAALDRLKRDGQYDSLQAAMNQARFGVSRAEETPLGRAAWHAPNPAAGYDAYVTEEGVSIAINDKTVCQPQFAQHRLRRCVASNRAGRSQRRQTDDQHRA